MAGEFVSRTLDNGLRVVIEIMPAVKSAACGFMAATGSRDEDRRLAGVSHFLEHMCFKGTPNRTCEQINVAFDEMGSFYNAFTSKERTFYYGWVQSADIFDQLALLADMMRSALPPAEFDVEKNVILEEIAMSNDQITHLAFDFLHERIFAGHPAAWPVLGYAESVRDLSRDDMHAYFTERYAPNNMLLVVAGNVQPDEVFKAAERVTAAWVPSASRPPRQPAPFKPGTSVKRIERFNQQEVALVFRSAGTKHELDETAEAISSILGGGNSRIFWNVVQTGLSSRAGAWRMDYEDFGMMILSGLCEPDQCERLSDALRAEASKFMAEGPDADELIRVKRKRRTSLAVEAEAPYYRLVQLMEDVDTFGEPRSVEERLTAVDAVSADTVRAYLNEFPIDRDEHLVSVGPREWPASAA